MKIHKLYERSYPDPFPKDKPSDHVNGEALLSLCFSWMLAGFILGLIFVALII